MVLIVLSLATLISLVGTEGQHLLLKKVLIVDNSEHELIPALNITVFETFHTQE